MRPAHSKLYAPHSPHGGTMRTRSVFCCLLVVATAAFSGQQPSFQNRLARTDRMAVPKSVRPFPTRKPITIGKRARLFQESRTSPRGLDSPTIVEPGAALAPAMTLPESTLINSGIAPAQLRSDRPYRLSETDSPNGLNTGTMPPTPFDTVYEQGIYGPRRHVYQNDAFGRTLIRSTQNRSSSGWEETERIECSYALSGQLATEWQWYLARGYECSIRDSYTYDVEGRVTAHHQVVVIPYGSLPNWHTDESSWYSPDGTQEIHQSESWTGDGRLLQGSKFDYLHATDSLEVAVWYNRTVSGWVPEERVIYRQDPSTLDQTGVSERWEGSHWVNHERYVLRGACANGEQECYHSWIWDGGSWVDDTRQFYFADSSGRSTEARFEVMVEGKDWMPTRRDVACYDDRGRLIYARHEHWNSGWTPGNILHLAYSASGGEQATDTTWRDGVLYWVYAWTTSDSTRQSYEERGESWFRGAIVQTYERTRSSTPTGDIAELTAWYRCDGRLEASRHAFAYDEAGRIASLRYYTSTDSVWADSFSWPADSGGGPGTCWQFYGSPGWTYFGGFRELRFHYRATVNQIGDDHLETPGTTALMQNYPNPFNPATTIPFAVATGARTTVTIFDVLGREVARPVDEWKDPGEYKVQFDASGLASGMYICRFSSGDVTQIRKLMLVR
jgi:hypothetical protein